MIPLKEKLDVINNRVGWNTYHNVFSNVYDNVHFNVRGIVINATVIEKDLHMANILNAISDCLEEYINEN